MTTSTWYLSKFDVAERQLLQAIRLFFNGGDEVSIHTLTEAAAQVLYDTRGQHGGGDSIFRDSDRIRPEYKKEWLKLLFRSRNFFKHGDKDQAYIHEFKASFNHFSLLDAINLYGSAKKAWTPETLLYYSWFFHSYPSVIKDDDSLLASIVKSNSNSPYPIDLTNFGAWSSCIDQLRSGHIRLNNVTLEMGLPREG